MLPQAVKAIRETKRLCDWWASDKDTVGGYVAKFTNVESANQAARILRMSGLDVSTDADGSTYFVYWYELAEVATVEGDA